MTEDEVKLIYGYLHENYEYRDGELIRTTTKQNNTLGSKKGFIGKKEGQYKMQASIAVNGKTFRCPLNKLVYLFHTKKMAAYLINCDGNITNNKIENLKEISKYESELPKLIAYKDKETIGSCFCKEKNKFRATIRLRKINIIIGYFLTQEEAVVAYRDIHNLFYFEHKTKQEIEQYIKSTYRRPLPSSGYRGVSKDGNQYVVRFMRNKKIVNVGRFRSPEEAHAAYLKAKEEYKNG